MGEIDPPGRRVGAHDHEGSWSKKYHGHGSRFAGRPTRMRARRARPRASSRRRAFTQGRVPEACCLRKRVEDNLIQPTFIYDYPIEVSPLAKRKKDDPMFTERFEYLHQPPCEFGNAFSELNDPIDQRQRFEKQVAAKRAQGANASVDEDFVTLAGIWPAPDGRLGLRPRPLRDAADRFRHPSAMCCCSRR